MKEKCKTAKSQKKTFPLYMYKHIHKYIDVYFIYLRDSQFQMYELE